MYSRSAAREHPTDPPPCYSGHAFDPVPSCEEPPAPPVQPTPPTHGRQDSADALLLLGLILLLWENAADRSTVLWLALLLLWA